MMIPKLTRAATHGFTRWTVGGAGHGATHMLPVLAELSRSAPREMDVRWCDPRPGKADAIAKRAAGSGIQAVGVQGTVEAEIEAHGADSTYVITIDSPDGMARAYQAALQRNCTAFGYFLIKFPDGGLYGFRVVVGSQDGAKKEEMAFLCSALAGVTARAGRRSVVGDRGLPEHRVAERLYRRWQADHLLQNAGKAAAGLEPESSPIEVTPDGYTTMPVVVQDSTSGWSEPRELARKVFDSLDTPVPAGDEVAIGEVGPDGIRLHRARIRVTDRRLGVGRSVALDDKALALLKAEEADRVRLEAERAIGQAKRRSISRAWPALVTD